MKYRFSCPKCGHGQESSFVRIGAQVECPRCGEVFRIEPEILEGGGASGLGPATGNRGPGAGGAGAGPDAEHLLGGEEPEALVGLSGLSGLMHGASDAGGGEGAGDAEADTGEGSGVGGAFPGNTGSAASFRGSAESGVGVEPFAEEEEDPPPAEVARAAAARGKPTRAPLDAPPTRDQLRRERAKQRAEAAEQKRRRRRITLFSTLAAGIAIGFLVGLFALLSGLGAAEPEEAAAAAPPARAAAVDAPGGDADAAGPRMIYARRVEGAAAATPTPLPGLGATAVALDNPLQQTLRLRVVLVAGEEPVPASIRLHLRADAPGGPAWIAGVAGGVPAGETRELVVALNPPLASSGWTWTPTPTP